MVQSGCVKRHSEEGGVEGEDMAAPAAAPFLFQRKFVVWGRKAIVSLPAKRPFYPNYLPLRDVPRTIYEVGGQILGSR